MSQDITTGQASRRNVLKATGAAGAAGLLAALGGSASAQQGGGGSSLFRNLDVTGELADGGTFDGTLNITQLDAQDGDLLVSGVLSGVATLADGTVQRLTQTITDILGSLSLGDTSGECPILNLDLGPLFLDLLGLEVDLAPIELDLTAVAGPGNLLGNLLCAVAGLLDG